MQRISIHPRGPLRKLDFPTSLPEHPDPFRARGLALPPPTLEASYEYLKPLGQRQEHRDSARRATSGNITDWKSLINLESSIGLYQGAGSVTGSHSSAGKNDADAQGLPNLGLPWGTRCSGFSDGFLEEHQSDEFSVSPSCSRTWAPACIHRSKISYKWLNQLTSSSGGKRSPPATSPDTLILLLGGSKTQEISCI